MLTLEMVREAQEALRDIARRTPLDKAPKFGENVYIKAENLQLTGAFKLRGAYNKIRSLTPEEAARGVIACSAGNHAQGIALSASRLGIKAVICMPAGAPISKVEATRSYGAEVVLVPGVYDDAAAEAERDYAAAFAALPKISWVGHCMYCGHCAPCPVGIDVAGVTKFLNLARAQGELPETVREHYAVLPHHGGECISCGACEKRCPFGVPVMENMRRAAEMFGN